MDFFGLDIGSSSIKLIQLAKEGNKFDLIALGEAPSPQPGIRGANPEHWTPTAESIKKLMVDLKIKTKNVVLGLPEDSVISRLKWFPSMKEDEIRAALEFEAETFIPYPLDQVKIDYEVIDKDDAGRLLVFVLAAPNTVVNKYLKVAKMAGLNPIALETPAVSLARIFSFGETPVLILDMGDKFSSLTVSKGGNVFLTRTIAISGDAFTRGVSLSLGLDLNVARGYCQAYGLKESELEGKVRSALMPLFEKLVDEVKKTVLSFKEEWQDDIGVVVLSGGGVNMPDLIEEMARVLGIEVQIAQPFTGVKSKTPITVDVRNEGSKFGTAFGLAARGMI